MHWHVITILIFYSTLASSQPYSKAKGKAGSIRYSYYIMEPGEPVKGILLLLPSRGEKSKKVFWRTAIPRHMAAHGFMTVIPQVDYSLILEERTRKILDAVISYESEKRRIDGFRLIVGGFSSGGAIAARYAEYKLSKDSLAMLGVLLIDPPLDLERFYKAWKPLSTSSCPKVIRSESRFIKKYIEDITGGPPEEERDRYLQLSALIASDSAGGNAKFLKDVAIRLYTEPDVGAMKARYCEEINYQNLNSTDLDALSALLIKLGNANVDYIKTKGRGLHSWNIVDPENLAEWGDALLKTSTP